MWGAPAGHGVEQRLGHAGGDGFAGCVVVAAIQHEGGAGLGQFVHDHGRGQAAVEGEVGFVQSGAAREEGAGRIGVGEHGVAQPTECHGIGGAGGGAGGGIGQGLGLKAGADGRGVQRARETAGFVERAAPAGAGRGVVRSEEKLRLLGLARQPVEVDVDRLLLPVDEAANAGGVLSARVNHGNVAPLAGTDRGADGADDDRISGVALAQAEFDLAVDEAQFAAAAVGGVVGGADVIDRGKQGDIAGIVGVRVEPKARVRPDFARKSNALAATFGAGWARSGRHAEPATPAGSVSVGRSATPGSAVILARAAASTGSRRAGSAGRHCHAERAGASWASSAASSRVCSARAAC